MNRITYFAAATLAMAFAWSGVANAIVVAPTAPPSDVGVLCSGGDNSGNDLGWIADHCGLSGTFTLQYKDNFGGVEEGDLASAYASSFNSDASGGTITWGGTQAVICTVSSPCYLIVKDGDHAPFRYMFNLTSVWDGTSTITLSGFWTGNGSISHWAIFGNTVCQRDCRPTDVPEPGTLGLLGLGLAGLGFGMRRRRKI